MSMPNEETMDVKGAVNDQFRLNYFSGYLDEVCKAVKWVLRFPASALAGPNVDGVPGPASPWQPALTAGGTESGHEPPLNHLPAALLLPQD